MRSHVLHTTPRTVCMIFRRAATRAMARLPQACTNSAASWAARASSSRRFLRSCFRRKTACRRLTADVRQAYWHCRSCRSRLRSCSALCMGCGWVSGVGGVGWGGTWTRTGHVPVLVLDGQPSQLKALPLAPLQSRLLQCRVPLLPLVVDGRPLHARVVVQGGKGGRKCLGWGWAE